MTMRPLAEQMQRNRDNWGEPYVRSSPAHATVDIVLGLQALAREALEESFEVREAVNG